jgi:hydrogenase maturation protease
MTASDTSPILVLGIGNPLMGDEGIGIRVAEILMSSFDFGNGVEVADAGTMGVGMINVFRDRDYVLVVDAVDGTEHPPGAIVTMEPEDMAPNQVMHSLHDQKLIDVLQAASLAGIEFEIDFIGVQIDRIEQWVTELSRPLEAALPSVVAAVLDTLATRGVRPSVREGGSVEGGILEAIRRAGDMPDEALEP